MIKSTLPLSLIISFRFLGLFLVLPVISVYALQLEGATAPLVGIVIGGYALTQMILQVPFGLLSDKIGRKNTIIIGSLIFALGSIICAISTDIYTLMFGRFLQGAGAIGGVVTAMISDLVIESKRSKAMALMGSAIAVSFAIAMLAGPILGANFGVENLFYVALVLALASIFILVKFVPNPPHIIHTYNEKVKIKEILQNPCLMKMNITSFLQKGLMTFAFMIIPIALIKHYQWEMTDLWKVYLPAVIFGIFAMGPAAVIAEKKRKFREVLVFGIVFFAISYLLLGFSTSSTFFVLGVVVFFIGFNVHEPIMQSLVSKFAKVHQRGIVLGIFNFFGYFGTFVGGMLGGYLYKNMSFETMVISIFIICILWVVLIMSMPNPSRQKFAYLSLDEYNTDKISNFDENEFVSEWYINNTENIIAIKYDDEHISEDEIKKVLK